MGLFRKMTSISTLGAVDFRSDKERTARYTRQTRDATRALVDQQDDEFREFQQWKADREAAQQREDRAIRERERTSAVARQERERREREQAALDPAARAQRRSGSRTSPDTMPLWLAVAIGLLMTIGGLALLVFIGMEIFGVRLGWWWAAVVVPMLVAGYFLDDSQSGGPAARSS